MQYQLPNATKVATKTVYDPAVYSDSQVADMANTASQKAMIQFQATGTNAQTVSVNGVDFNVYVKMQNGSPYVSTAYPAGATK